MSESGLMQQAMWYEDHVRAKTRHENCLLTPRVFSWAGCDSTVIWIPASSWWRRLLSGTTDHPF